MKDTPIRFVCNNCAATKAGEQCADCVGKGCNCTCQEAQGKPDSEAKPRHVIEVHENSAGYVWHCSCGKVWNYCYANLEEVNKHCAVERVQPEPAKFEVGKTYPANVNGEPGSVTFFSQDAADSYSKQLRPEPVPSTSVEPQVEPSKVHICPSCGAGDNNPYTDANGNQMRACGRCMIQWRVAADSVSHPPLEQEADKLAAIIQVTQDWSNNLAREWEASRQTITVHGDPAYQHTDKQIKVSDEAKRYAAECLANVHLIQSERLAAFVRERSKRA